MGARTVSFTMKNLVRSAQPAVVFTSLAALSVPTFSDKCSVVIEEDDELTYRIGRAVDDCASPERDYSLRTPVVSGPAAGHGEFRGVVIHSWCTGHRPTYADAALARLMVERAVASIHQERVNGRRPAWAVGDAGRREQRLRYPDCPARARDTDAERRSDADPAGEL